ncbi:ATP-binding protein [Helicobacter sp. MIT 00-7814]|uniref:dynamin family protein n=1 Tax=unclassified Helicobacter TaxID=2593540 RepID=UPI000E1EE8DF|nr:MULTISPECIES: dynamin family protein [unclassified Helicobacter]RDU54218.1 ATP-binding protein [Helicobacter sp. MIT 00-7814]RDU56036.1 ATP-binding protein [Helicobacter sp. MIT 99-10781]
MSQTRHNPQTSKEIPAKLFTCKNEQLAILLAFSQDLNAQYLQSEVIKELFAQLGQVLNAQNLSRIAESSQEILPKLESPALLAINSALKKIQNAQICEEAHIIAMQKKIKNLLQENLLQPSEIKEQFFIIAREIQALFTNTQFEDKKTTKAIESIIENLTNGHFSIGVSGVLSAGKSTFLNALLGEEILSTSTIPETANLTILQYGAKNCAQVRFWSRGEWEELCAQKDADIRQFVKETQELFNTNLAGYLTEPPRVEEISLDSLSAYTSANHKDKFCNLVREVRINLPLKFLEQNVSIVDTPGLDDPITKREEITKSYLVHCDLLIHLMNASCAATQTDIDFILETLSERNISRLLVVLTRADLISQKELEQSLNYTKQSLRAQIAKLSAKIDVSEMLSRITFIPLCGHDALLHRINDSARTPKVALEKTGILEIEQYLQTLLFGENSLKSRDMLYLALNALQKLVREKEADLELESSLLFASDIQLQEKISEIKAQNDSLHSQAKSAKEAILAKFEELKNALNTMQNAINTNLQSQRERLCERICGNIAYDRAQKRAFEVELLQDSLLIGLKDIFADTTRGFKFHLNAKISQTLQALQNEGFVGESELLNAPNFSFYAKDSQVELFAKNLSAQIAKYAKTREFQAPIQKAFEEVFLEFEKIIFEKSAQIKSENLAFFDSIAQNAYKAYEEQIAHTNALLNQTLARREEGKNKNLEKEMGALQENLSNISHKLDSLRAFLEA